MKLKPFTVVGLYLDDYNSFVVHIDAVSAMEAATSVGESKEKEGLEFAVVSVFSGHLQAKL